jgi:hypothetical protein
MGYSFTRDALLLVLADGMGGHLRGEIAATIALQTMSTLFQQQATPYVKKPERFLEEAFMAAHRDIHRYRAMHNLPETPRTTVVACLIQHNCASGRTAATRACTGCARPDPGAHARPFAHRAPDRQGPGRSRPSAPPTRTATSCTTASARRRLPKVELSRRPACSRATCCCCAPTACGRCCPTSRDGAAAAPRPSCSAVPDLLRMATRDRRPAQRQHHRAGHQWQGAVIEDDCATTVGAGDMRDLDLMLPEDLAAPPSGHERPPACRLR